MEFKTINLVSRSKNVLNFFLHHWRFLTFACYSSRSSKNQLSQNVSRVSESVNQKRKCFDDFKHRFIKSLKKGKIGKNHELKTLKRFTGNSLEALKNPNLSDMIDDYLERIGISNENDRNFVFQKLEKLVSTKHESKKKKKKKKEEKEGSSDDNPESDSLSNPGSDSSTPNPSDDSELANVE